MYFIHPEIGKLNEEKLEALDKINYKQKGSTQAVIDIEAKFCMKMVSLVNDLKQRAAEKNAKANGHNKHAT